MSTTKEKTEQQEVTALGDVSLGNCCDMLCESYQRVQMMLMKELTMTHEQEIVVGVFFKTLQQQLTLFHQLYSSDTSSTQALMSVVETNITNLYNDIKQLVMALNSKPPLVVVVQSNEIAFTIINNEQLKTTTAQAQTMTNKVKHSKMKPIIHKEGNKFIRNHHKYNTTTGELTEIKHNNNTHNTLYHVRTINTTHNHNNKRDSSLTRCNVHNHNTMNSSRVVSPVSTLNTIKVFKSPKIENVNFSRLMRPTKSFMEKQRTSCSNRRYSYRLNKSTSAKTITSKNYVIKGNSNRTKVFDTLSTSSHEKHKVVVDSTQLVDKIDECGMPSNYAQYLVKKYKDVVNKFKIIDNEEVKKSGKIKSRLFSDDKKKENYKGMDAEFCEYLKKNHHKLFRNMRIKHNNNNHNNNNSKDVIKTECSSKRK